MRWLSGWLGLAVLLAILAVWECAARLGLVTLEQMVAALVHAVETPAQGVRIVKVPEIRAAGKNFPSG